jgi:hypothetical protein
MRAAVPCTPPAVAVIVEEPTVVELRIWTVYVPFPLSVTPPID